MTWWRGGSTTQIRSAVTARPVGRSNEPEPRSVQPPGAHLTIVAEAASATKRVPSGASATAIGADHRASRHSMRVGRAARSYRVTRARSGSATKTSPCAFAATPKGRTRAPGGRTAGPPSAPAIQSITLRHHGRTGGVGSPSGIMPRRLARGLAGGGGQETATGAKLLSPPASWCAHAARSAARQQSVMAARPRIFALPAVAERAGEAKLDDVDHVASIARFGGREAVAKPEVQTAVPVGERGLGLHEVEAGSAR